MVFVINPYDRCVVNEMINRKQCTIMWYGNDNKLYHVDPNIVTICLEEINLGELVINRGDENYF